MITKFIPYDRFKLAVTILLILLLILVRCSMDSGKAAAPAIEPTAQPSVETTEAAPAATTAATVEPTAAPAAEPTAETACTKALPIRISGTGVKVRVVNALIPLRASPEVKDGNILAALPIGTELEVIGLPVCTDYLTGANQWWGVRMQDGRTGYAAEGSAINSIYYLEEIN